MKYSAFFGPRPFADSFGDGSRRVLLGFTGSTSEMLAPNGFQPDLNAKNGEKPTTHLGLYAGGNWGGTAGGRENFTRHSGFVNARNPKKFRFFPRSIEGGRVTVPMPINVAGRGSDQVNPKIDSKSSTTCRRKSGKPEELATEWPERALSAGRRSGIATILPIRFCSSIA